ncbi:MAG: hypothetical protein AB7F25_11975 [Deferribacterales bacterium]
MQFSMVCTLAGIGATLLLFGVWFVVGILLENRRIKQKCLLLADSICILRNSSEELNETQKACFEHLADAFETYIKPNAKYKSGLVRALNSICGCSHSQLDMFDCFEHRHVNSFFRDMVNRSGYLFINMIYMAHLEQKGFHVADMGGGISDRL